MGAQADRQFLPDLFKAAGCLLIVAHHLAFYGPMSDTVGHSWPGLIQWLVEYARMAVQGFLVVSGFLTARVLVNIPATGGCSLYAGLMVQRYFRLAVPLLAALTLTVLITELIRPAFDHSSLSRTPQWPQALAHVWMLQDVLGLEALSAGVWYVAIDLQLFALAMLSGWACRRAPDRIQSLTRLWLLLTLCSLLWWNTRPQLDDWAIYFCGAYGMGMLAGLGRLRSEGPSWPMGFALMVLGAVAWWHLPRERILLACLLSIVLTVASRLWMHGPDNPARQWIERLSRYSYAVFVIHFGVSLAVSALVVAFQWSHVGVQAAGMVSAVLLSILAGALLHRLVETSRPTARKWSVMAAGFMAASLLVPWLSG